MREADMEKISIELMKLQHAMIDCAEVFEKVDERELNEIICKSYPFDKSFDEMVFEVIAWTKLARLNLHAAVKRKERENEAKQNCG